jgi:hypothetical protein
MDGVALKPLNYQLAFEPGAVGTQHAYLAGTGRTLCGLSLGHHVHMRYATWRRRPTTAPDCRRCVALVCGAG